MEEKLQRFEPYRFSYGPDKLSGVVRPTAEMERFADWLDCCDELNGVKISRFDIGVADGELFGIFEPSHVCERGDTGPLDVGLNGIAQKLERDVALHKLFSDRPLPSCHLYLSFSVDCPQKILDDHLSDLERLKNRSLPKKLVLDAVELTEVKSEEVGYRIRPELRSEIHKAFVEAQLDRPSLKFAEFLQSKYASDNGNSSYDEFWVETIIAPGPNAKCFHKNRKETTVKTGKVRVTFTLMASSLDDPINRIVLHRFLSDTIIAPFYQKEWR